MEERMKVHILICIIMLLFISSVYAGERYDTFLFGVDYYPEHWPEHYWEQDAKWMKECGVNTVRMGEFAWYYMEPEEGVYQFELFDRAIAMLAKHGIKTILGTPTATPPKWLTHKYPETLTAYANGQVVDDQSRRHYSYNSPVYRRFSKKIVEAMAQHFQNNPNIIGWQIDNEFNCHIEEFFGENERVAFREWLKRKYGNLDSLNERWGNRFWSQWYTDWEQIDLPFPTPAYHNPALMLDHKRFISDSVIDFQKDQVIIIRKYRPDDFITHNGTFRYIDYYKFCNDLDIFADDVYPCFWENPQYPVGARLNISRGYKGRFMIMEQQTGPGGQAYLQRTPRPGEMSMWAFRAIAYGADGMLHFRWRTALKGAEEYWFGVLEQDNVTRWRFEEFKKEGLELQKIGNEIFGSTLQSDIAVINDFEAQWVYDYQFMTREIDIGDEFTGLFQAASEMKYSIDFIGCAADFSRYKIIFAPHLIMMDKQLAEKIGDFVENGGTFIVSAHSAVKDRDNGMTDQVQPILIREIFGVDRIGFNCYQPPSKGKNALRFNDGATVPINVFADELKLNGAQEIAEWDRDYLQGRTACTEKSVGKGKAVYYGSFFNLESARYLLSRYTAVHNMEPLMTGIPKEIEVSRRTKNGTNYYFIINNSDDEVKINPGNGYYDIIDEKPLPLEYVLKAFEYKVLRK